MRIHFTRGDLARTHLADGADAMWEMINSLQALQTTYGRTAFRTWRRRVGSDLTKTDLAQRVRGRLFPVAPNAAYYPDLLTPPEGALGLEEALETILTTPRHRLQTEIGALKSDAGEGAWLSDLGSGRPGALTELGETLRAYHRVSIAPYWDEVSARVSSDLALRRRALKDGGISGLLDSFRPMMQWRSPVLSLPTHPSSRDVYLEGRGLVLIPSYFCHVHPVTIFSAELPQVIVYPVEHPVLSLAAPNGLALERLLGDTRAAVLRAVQDGCTTSELSQTLGVAPATISHHTGILRDAGLIVSRRTANTMLHTLTPLGVALLSGS